METGVVIAIIVAIVGVLVIAAIGMWMYSQRRRSEELQSHFGSEYDRTLEEHGDRKQAESELQARRAHVEKLYIRPLSADERDRYSDEWLATQADFVDDPAGAINRADDLVNEVMRTRGYPTADFEARAADVSVDHPQVVENYRAAHTIAEASEGGDADTEDLRQAFVHYRALFDELLETSETKRTEAA